MIRLRRALPVVLLLSGMLLCLAMAVSLLSVAWSFTDLVVRVVWSGFALVFAVAAVRIALAASSRF